MKEDAIEYLAFLKDRLLTAITFLQAYFQLEFDYATVTCYTWPVILGEAADYEIKDVAYIQALHQLIGSKVHHITITDKGLIIGFESAELLFKPEGNREILFFVDENSEWYSYPYML